MWFLWELFDDVVDIASIPVRATTKVADTIITLWEEEPITDFYNEVREATRINR